MTPIEETLWPTALIVVSSASFIFNALLWGILRERKFHSNVNDRMVGWVALVGMLTGLSHTAGMFLEVPKKPETFACYLTSYSTILFTGFAVMLLAVIAIVRYRSCVLLRRTSIPQARLAALAATLSVVVLAIAPLLGWAEMTPGQGSGLYCAPWFDLGARSYNILVFAIVVVLGLIITGGYFRVFAALRKARLTYERTIARQQFADGSGAPAGFGQSRGASSPSVKDSEHLAGSDPETPLGASSPTLAGRGGTVSERMRRDEATVSKRMFIAVLAFFACYGPSCVGLWIVAVDQEPVPRNLEGSLYCIFVGNSLLNPLVFIGTNGKYQKRLRELVSGMWRRFRCVGSCGLLSAARGPSAAISGTGPVNSTDSSVALPAAAKRKRSGIGVSGASETRRSSLVPSSALSVSESVGGLGPQDLEAGEQVSTNKDAGGVEMHALRPDETEPLNDPARDDDDTGSSPDEGSKGPSAATLAPLMRAGMSETAAILAATGMGVPSVSPMARETKSMQAKKQPEGTYAIESLRPRKSKSELGGDDSLAVQQSLALDVRRTSSSPIVVGPVIDTTPHAAGAVRGDGASGSPGVAPAIGSESTAPVESSRDSRGAVGTTDEAADEVEDDGEEEAPPMLRRSTASASTSALDDHPAPVVLRSPGLPRASTATAVVVSTGRTRSSSSTTSRARISSSVVITGPTDRPRRRSSVKGRTTSVTGASAQSAGATSAVDDDAGVPEESGPPPLLKRQTATGADETAPSTSSGGSGSYKGRRRRDTPSKIQVVKDDDDQGDDVGYVTRPQLVIMVTPPAPVHIIDSDSEDSNASGSGGARRR